MTEKKPLFANKTIEPTRNEFQLKSYQQLMVDCLALKDLHIRNRRHRPCQVDPSDIVNGKHSFTNILPAECAM